MAPLRKKVKVAHISSDEEDESLTDLNQSGSHEDSEGSPEDASSASSSALGDDEQHKQESDSNDEEEVVDVPKTGQAKQKQANGTHMKVTNGSGASGNMLALQVDSMLQQIRPKHTRREIEAEEALHALRKTIEAVPALGPFPISDARTALTEQNIVIPFPDPQPPKSSNLKFTYAPPASLNVVGSYPIKTANRSRKFLHVDMVVQMPDSIFQEKDFINYRYFHKRAFYLACLASAIQAGHSRSFEIKFQNHHDDPLRPVLTIRSLTGTTMDSDGPARKWQINILPSVGNSLFQAAKLVPAGNSIRQTDSRASRTALQAQNAAYNSSLRADMLVTDYLRLLNKASTNCEAYRDACALGSTWLHQRGFRATPRRGGFASFEWAALLALLLQAEVGGRTLLAAHMSSVQIFKTVLQLLTSRDLVKMPLIVGSGTDMGEGCSGGPIVWDAARAHNLLYKTPAWSFRRLQAEAKTTLTMLGDPEFDGFEACFTLKKTAQYLNYDYTVKVRVAALTTESAGDAFMELYRLLKRGLGNRVTQINLTAARSKVWDIGRKHNSDTDATELRVGLLVNAKTVNRAVDHGPAAEDKDAAAEFQSFWGDKAELRRFKDGSITEALVWETGPGSLPILEQVVRHLLRKKFGNAAAENAVYMTDAFAQMAPSSAESPSMAPFRKLEADIRGLQAIPLPIRQIMPAQLPGNSPSLKSAKLRKSTITDVVMQFESSGRWPDDLAAIQRTKIAFLLQISTLLQEHAENVQALVGLENEEQDIMNQGFLDILYPGTATFRLRIFHDREQTLLDRILKDKSASTRATELAAHASATFKREYIRRPIHAQAMTQLCSHHPALRCTIAVLQKWSAGHLLSNYLSDELIELFAAHTFTKPWPWQTPTSVQTAFLRTIMWLARWDWRAEPLIVNVSTDRKLPSADKKAARVRYDAWRKLDPAMSKVAMFVASSVDLDGTTYSSEGPSKVIAGRLTTLARAAASEIQAKDLDLVPKTLFVSSYRDFDFVLHLHPHYALAASSKHSKIRPFKNMELSAASDIIECSAQPGLDFLSEIRALYGTSALFLSGLPHKPVIAGLWTPQTAERAWKVNLTYSTVPVQGAADDVIARVNSAAILAEIARLGGELVERIELPKE